MANSIKPLLLDSTGKEIVYQLSKVADALKGEGGDTVGETLDETSWKMVNDLAMSNKFADYFKVGDVKHVLMGGYTGLKSSVPAIVAGINTYGEGTVDFILQAPLECYDYRINTGYQFGFAYPNTTYSAYNTNNKPVYSGPLTPASSDWWIGDDEGRITMSFANSQMRTFNKNTMFNFLPESLRAVIKPKPMVFNAFERTEQSGYTGYVVTTMQGSDLLWTPSYYELMGEDVTKTSGSTKYIIVCESNYHKFYEGARDIIRQPVNHYFPFSSVCTSNGDPTYYDSETSTYTYHEGDFIKSSYFNSEYVATEYRYPSTSSSSSSWRIDINQSLSTSSAYAFNYFGFRVGKEI